MIVNYKKLIQKILSLFILSCIFFNILEIKYPYNLSAIAQENTTQTKTLPSKPSKKDQNEQEINSNIIKKQENLESLIKSSQEDSKTKNLIRSEIKDYLGLTFDLLNILIIVLISIPILTGIFAIWARSQIISYYKEEFRNFQEKLKSAQETSLKAIEEADVISTQIDTIKEKHEELTTAYIEINNKKTNLSQKLGRNLPTLLEEELNPEKLQEIRDDLNQIISLVDLPNISWTSYDYRNIADAYTSLNQYNEGLKFYNKALNEQPANQDRDEVYKILNNKGITHSHLKQFNEEIECYEKALNKNPNYLESRYNLACAYTSKEKFKEAIEELKKAKEINSNKVKEWAKNDSDFKPFYSNETYKNQFLELINNDSKKEEKNK